MSLIINGTRVGDDVIEEEFDAIKTHYQNLGEVVCCDRDDEFRVYAHDNIINRTLLEQESVKRFGEVPEEEIDASLAKLMEEHGGEDKFFENTGFKKRDEAMLRRKVAATVAVNRLLEEEIGDDPEPTEADLKKFYEENQDRYMTPEEVRASHIFKEPKTHEQAEQCFKELRAAREKLLDGADFEEMARQISDKEEDEIDLGFYKRGEMMHEIEVITFSMRLGEISPVIATHFGIHLIKVTDRKPPEPIPFEEVKDQLAEVYLSERRDKLLDQFIGGLKDAATIEEVEPEHEEVEG